MKAIKILITIILIGVMHQFASAQICQGNKVKMFKGGVKCGCHCQKKCVLQSEVQTYIDNGWNTWGCYPCCWLRVNEPEDATETKLTAIYPNPASGSVVISFSLAEQGDVILQVFDLTGRYVSTVSNEFYEEGENEVIWDSSILNSGVYFLKMQVGSFEVTKRIMVTN